MTSHDISEKVDQITMSVLVDKARAGGRAADPHRDTFQLLGMTSPAIGSSGVT